MQFRALSLLTFSFLGTKEAVGFTLGPSKLNQQALTTLTLTSQTSKFTRAQFGTRKDSQIFQTSEKGESSSSKDVTPALERIDELTDEKVADMIELTFIKACLQLATGYVDVLKLFLAATNSAYDNGISFSTIIELVANSPNNSANRPLSPQEIELRSGWIAISYLTLETMDRLEGKKENIANMDIPEDVREKFGVIVEEKVREDLGLEPLSLSESSSTASNNVNDDTSDAQAAAVMSYNLKIISLTLSNLAEGKEAYNFQTLDEDGVGPPRPNIPGAY